VVQCLIALLEPSVDPERHCNAAQLICDVIKMSRENQHTSTERSDPDPILNTIEAYVRNSFNYFMLSRLYVFMAKHM
jgi:serine/threonine-protein phosphatase 6 regulatory subunit 3